MEVEISLLAAYNPHFCHGKIYLKAQKKSSFAEASEKLPPQEEEVLAVLRACTDSQNHLGKNPACTFNSMTTTIVDKVLSVACNIHN